jgi:hypothetical protein
MGEFLEALFEWWKKFFGPGISRWFAYLLSILGISLIIMVLVAGVLALRAGLRGDPFKFIFIEVGARPTSVQEASTLQTATIELVSEGTETPQSLPQASSTVALISTNAPMPTSTLTSTPEPFVRIARPEDGAEIDLETSIEGTYEGIPDDHEIWVVIQPEAVDRFYPESNPAERANGRWISPANVGGPGDAGKQFTIYATLVDLEAQEKFRTYIDEALAGAGFTGLLTRPVGAEIMDEVVVTRR